MSRDEFVQQIKECGQSIIDNAEMIYNHFQFPTEGLMIEIDVDRDRAPTITVVKKFIPETFCQRLG